MGKYKYKLKKKTNNRGGYYKNFKSGTIYDGRTDERLPANKVDLKIGDEVEINNTLNYWLTLKILEIKSDDYIKGIVNSDRISSCYGVTCNICDKYSDPESNGKEDFLYCCNGILDNSCDFHVHRKCFKNINKNNKPCNCKLEYISFQNGTIVYFKKSEVRYLY